MLTIYTTKLETGKRIVLYKLKKKRSTKDFRQNVKYS